MRQLTATCGSKILEKYISPYDATAIQRLEAADAICVGKTNMDEFGMGSTNENSAFGLVRNPHDPSRIPGGSSGGSAAAVSAGMAMAALGTDTGGSVRQPASHCGIIGLRPTYGRVSRYGLIAFASSLDTVGCLTRSAEDACRLLQVIAGKDPLDSTSSDQPVPDYLGMLGKDVKGLRIGLPDEFFKTGLNSEIRLLIDKTLEVFKKHGATVQPISLPHSDYGIATYYLICTAEASSNLARYDGIRYGMRSQETDHLQKLFMKTRSLGFGAEVKRRIMLGTYILSAGYYDAYYRKAQKIRSLIRQDFEKAFEICDVIVGPTVPTTANRIGELIEDPLVMYLSDVFTVTAPLAGLPAISVPIGKDSSNMPVGMQITGKAFAEGEILSMTHWIENHIDPEIRCPK